MVLTSAFMLFSVGSFAAKGSIKSHNTHAEIIKVKTMVMTFTDGCGTEWTITASCGTCSNNDLAMGITDWMVNHETGTGVDDEPCYE